MPRSSIEEVHQMKIADEDTEVAQLLIEDLYHLSIDQDEKAT
jgi:hypothetical protein